MEVGGGGVRGGTKSLLPIQQILERTTTDLAHKDPKTHGRLGITKERTWVLTQHESIWCETGARRQRP